MKVISNDMKTLEYSAIQFRDTKVKLCRGY